MYRGCIFCSAPLGSNDSIERFPVGRSLAFDAAKGRLWAVCAKCARWNLAPIEERWEAIDDAERIFRDTRLRVQRENIGLTRLADGTRLIRIGRALPGEMAAWRYGQQLARRESRALLYGAAVVAGGIAFVATGTLLTASGAGLLIPAYRYAVDRARDLRSVGHAEVHAGGVRARVRIRRQDVARAWLCDPGDGRGMALNFARVVTAPDPRRGGAGRDLPVTVRGDAALPLLSRAMVHVNAAGADPAELRTALGRIQAAGSADGFLREVVRRRLRLTGGEATDGDSEPLVFGDLFIRPSDPDSTTSLAMEMALHEETERRALDGELAMLEAMWRQAEEIAEIADALPGVPPSEPPRIVPG